MLNNTHLLFTCLGVGSCDGAGVGAFVGISEGLGVGYLDGYRDGYLIKIGGI